MNLFHLKMAVGARSQPKHIEVEIVAFERIWRPADKLMISAGISFICAGRRQYVTASLTWEALALMRAEAKRAGTLISDEDLIEAILTTWAKDEIKKRMVAGQSTNNQQIVLAFGGGPANSQPRRLIQEGGLLAQLES